MTVPTEAHADGDVKTHDVDAAVSKHDAVVLASAGVSPLATSNGFIYGIALEAGAAGERVAVALRGIWPINAAASMTPGIYATGSTTAGEVRERVTSGTGEEAQQLHAPQFEETTDSDGKAVISLG